MEVNQKYGMFHDPVKLILHDPIDGNKEVQKCRMIGSKEYVKTVVKPSDSTETIKPKKVEKVNLYKSK